jgi:hypothetical protein
MDLNIIEVDVWAQAKILALALNNPSPPPNPWNNNVQSLIRALLAHSEP